MHGQNQITPTYWLQNKKYLWNQLLAHEKRFYNRAKEWKTDQQRWSLNDQNTQAKFID